jgi:type I restriction enzyme S subunit
VKLPAYPRYKPSGVAWLGDVPEHWDVDRLKWTTTGTVNGIWGDEPNGADDMICVRVADFDRDRFLVADEPPTLRAVDAAQRNGRILRRGDLLIEKSGGGEKQLVGCVVLFDHEFPAVCSNFVARMPTLPHHDARFWSYAHASLYAGRLNYPAIKQTTGIQNLDSAAYLDTRVGLPPDAEQRAVADFLDRATARIDALVAKKRTLIERLKEKRTALISRIVTRGLPPDAARAAGLDPHPRLRPSGVAWLGDVPEHWTARRLKQISDVVTVGVVVNPSSYVADEGVPFLLGGDIREFRIDADNCNKCAPESSDGPLRKSRLDPGDVVVVRVGYPGIAAVVPPELAGANCASMMLVRRHKRFCSQWLAYTFNSQAGRDQVDVVQYGAAQKQFNISHAVNFVFPFPPLPEQRAIAAYLDGETAKLDALAAKVETAIERLQEYRTALITAAVTGKLDVRESSPRGNLVLETTQGNH